MCKLLIISGIRNSGKTTLGNYLRDHMGWTVIHPVGWFIRRLEEAYDLPPYYLDTQEGKNMRMEGGRDTFLRFLEDWFVFINENAEGYTGRHLYVDMCKAALRKENIVVLSIRNLNEVTAINRFLSSFPYYKAKTIHLINPHNKLPPKASDAMAEPIQRLLDIIVPNSIVIKKDTVEEMLNAAERYINA